MNARGKRPRKSGVEPRRPSDRARTPTASPTPTRDVKEIARAYGTLALSAVLMFLGFAGFGIWPLAFIGMIPALLVLDVDPPAGFAKVSGWAFFRRALFFGYIAYYGGFHWIVDTIHVFGEFPYLLAAFFASAFFVFQGLQYVLVLALFRRARARGFPGELVLVPAFVGVEFAFPHLFDHFYGNSLHEVSELVQVADLGGPMLVTALLMLGNAAGYSLVRAVLKKEPLPRVAPLVFVGALALYYGYGRYRIDEVETRMAHAETLEVGVVQVNMGIQARYEDPGESTRRHLEQSLELEAEGPLDLLIWPESSLDFSMPRDHGLPVAPTFRMMLERHFRKDYPGFPEAPILFGASSRVEIDGRQRPRNTSFLVDTDGRVAGHYDKTYLLMFGEYLPFGETFPILYEWSPNSGDFTSGDDVSPVVLDGHPISLLVCYEDILPRFTRRVVREGSPELLVNQTNDAWFVGPEPRVHRALAEMRAVEHHRTLIRATLTGISAVIDPVGRVVSETAVGTRDNLRAEVPLLNDATLYQTVGDWPGMVAFLAIGFLGFIGRRRPLESPPPAKRPLETAKKDDDDESE